MKIWERGAYELQTQKKMILLDEEELYDRDTGNEYRAANGKCTYRSFMLVKQCVHAEITGLGIECKRQADWKECVMERSANLSIVLI